MTILTPLSAHIMTVGADANEQKRTAILAKVVEPISSTVFSSLEEMGDFNSDAPTLIRLFGTSATQVLTWLKSDGRVASEVAILGVADAILVVPGESPHVVGVLPQAFLSAIASAKQTYDQTGTALLIGANDETRGVAAGVARLGFKRILIVGTDDRKSEQLVQILKKRVFGVQFEVVPRASLTQLPNESSLAINLADPTESALLEDASYLNFFRSGGLWIDWTSATEALHYGAEIIDAGAHVFHAAQIRAWRDVLLLGQFAGHRAGGGSDGSPDGKPEKRLDSLVADLLSATVEPAAKMKTDPS